MMRLSAKNLKKVTEQDLNIGSVPEPASSS